ncbi:MAG: arylsulfatase [Verrucomicrobiota bacterium]
MRSPDFLILLILFSASQHLLVAEEPSTTLLRPNVILMMADDMGMGDTSAYQDFTGNSDQVQVDTPHMERLARMGVRFTDAHTPSSRCSPTRYGLLTGRYPWRNRLKHWVLFGSQGDPMIERDRPTLGTLFGEAGYTTAMTGKWHIGLRYRNAQGEPAAGWKDADLTQPLFDTPSDHGFELARYTSRSHGTSGPDAGNDRKNGPNQTVGPGHLHDRNAVGATGNGKDLIREGENAYVHTELGSRFSDRAIEYLSSHLEGAENSGKPFFLYYPSPSNHGPYTPDEAINSQASRGASRTKTGEPMDLRHDYIHENDLILGRFLDWLEAHEDPRAPGKKLSETTIVVFTSDNGAEKNHNVATGPFRSNKGSTYEGGHRVPYLVSWPEGQIGDGNASTEGGESAEVICHTDLYATFAEILEVSLPDPTAGEKGAEDSFSILSAWRGEPIETRPPIFAHDHKEAKSDPAVSALRLDSPVVDGEVVDGQWKLFFDASLLRKGEAVPIELYNLEIDPGETDNLISDPELALLVQHLSKLARHHRNIGGHRLASIPVEEGIVFDLTANEAGSLVGEGESEAGNYRREQSGVTMQISLSEGEPHFNFRGMGASEGATKQVDDGETLTLSFDRDVVLQHLAIVAGNGQCGGFYQISDGSPLAIYCIDGDVDEKDQSGVLSDLGVIKMGQTILLSSAPHYGSEAPGQWRLASVMIRPVRR